MNLPIKACIQGAVLLQKQSSAVSHALNPIAQVQKLPDTVFVRHAHSQFNKACQDYRIKHKIDYDWDALRNHKGFDEAVAYNKAYIDCPLTDKGIQQCYITSQNLDLRKIDVILVSPHNRALQTCDNILKFSSTLKKRSEKIPVIVDSLIAGSLWSSCDISYKMEKKVPLFPCFDFSQVSSLPELWYTANLKQSDKQKISSLIAQRKLTKYEDKQLLVLQLLRTNQISQSRELLRQRSWMIKNELRKLKEKHCNLLLVSHYYVIQYINSRAFGPLDHKPVDDVDLKNCSPYYNNLEKILAYK